MTRSARCGLAVCAVALLAGCNKPVEKPLPVPSPPAPAVSTNTMTNAAPPPTARALEMPYLPDTVAEIVGIKSTPVLAGHAGYLVRQLHKEHDLVAAGDTLFLLDPRASHPEGANAGNKDAGLVKIIAPTAGAMGPALRGEGDWVNEYDDVATIDDVKSVEAQFKLKGNKHQWQLFAYGKVSDRPESARPGAFELVLPDGSIYPYKGVISWAANANMDGSGPDSDVSVIFPNPDHVLLPGEYVKVHSPPR